MNRLVIIGNGFDLAHGLPTSYKDFIDDYWKNVLVELSKTNKSEDGFLTIDISRASNNFEVQEDWNKVVNNFESINFFVRKHEKYCSLNIANNFFKTINNKLDIENWVDIENIYYVILKEKVKGNHNNYPWDVNQLNLEFEQIKNLLEKYLNEKVVEKYKLDFTNYENNGWDKFYNALKPISLFSNENNILKEFIKAEDVDEIKEHFEEEREEELANNLYFLNFNYTPIASIYSEIFQKDDRIESEVNFIHGELKNVSNNKVNFGFGDEMDEDYKLIENIDDNEYLKNFKSFKYLQNSNYNDLLRYIDSEKFQVLIMGHSCGLSDRTLLNTIFEHNNCRSIKVFYHERRDENGKVINDNYTEITQNISRHFNKKKLMREKIVNKTLCQPLPQIQLPLK
ncbi:Bacteriophage abortive infection AbiH [Flavobacteriaceae bacterium]